MICPFYDPSIRDVKMSEEYIKCRKCHTSKATEEIRNCETCDKALCTECLCECEKEQMEQE